MPEKLTDLSVSAFTERLAGRTAVPGGGGAAALTGAQGVALILMAGQFTLGKKKYAEYEDDIRGMLSEGGWLYHELLSLVDADAAAFEPLSKAYAIPKEDPNREQILEEATKGAIEVPSRILSSLSSAVPMADLNMCPGRKRWRRKFRRNCGRKSDLKGAGASRRPLIEEMTWQKF